MLKARRPRQGTFVHWQASLGKIKDALENDLPLSVKDWSDLTPDLQEIVSFEYLREVGINNWKIKYLLMPIGRTMKDIDIYALNDKNEKVFVQVTNQGDDKLKLEFLSNYVGEKVYISSRDKSQYQNTNIHYLSTDTIFKWLKTKQTFLDNLMC